MVRLAPSSSAILFLGRFGWELARKTLCMRFADGREAAAITLWVFMVKCSDRCREAGCFNFTPRLVLLSSGRADQWWPRPITRCLTVDSERQHSYEDFSTSSHFAVTVWQQHAHGFSDWWMGDTSETPAALSDLPFLAPPTAVQCLILRMNPFPRMLIEVLLL